MKFLENKYLPFMIMATVMAVFYFTATDKFGDDLLIVETVETNPLFSNDGIMRIIINIYHSWSSRVIIFPTMVVFSLSPIFLWRVLELACWVGIAVIISKLFTDEKNNWLVVALMLLYPYWHMLTAGWIATTTNYTWPLFFGMFALLHMKRLYQKAELRTYRWVLFVVAGLYASDAEQMLMILFIVFSALAIRELQNTQTSNLRYRRTVFCGWVFLAARVIFTATTPGNHARQATGHHTVPNFAEYSIWERLRMAFELTGMHYTVFTAFLFPVFAIFLLIIVWNLYENPLKRAVAAMPLVISLIFSIEAAVSLVEFLRKNLANHLEMRFLDELVLAVIPTWTGSNVLFLVFFICLFYIVHLISASYSESGGGGTLSTHGVRFFGAVCS